LNMNLGKALLIFRDYIANEGVKVPVALLSHFGTATVERWIQTLRAQGIREIQVFTPKEAVLQTRDYLEKIGEANVEVNSIDDLRFKTTEGALIISADYLVHPDAVRSFIQGSYTKGTCKQTTVLQKVVKSEPIAVDLDSLVEPRHRPACVYAGDLKASKAALVKWSQKGIHLTSMLNAHVENLIVKSIGGNLWITPNRITMLVNLLALAVIYLFLKGHFIFGSVVAYIAGILDGVDGKLARVRGRLTRLGHIEHSLDALWEQSVYAALAVGLGAHGYGVQALIMGIIFLVIDSFIRHVYNQFTLITGRSLKTYSAFDRKFAVIDGRRNFYVIYFLVSSILGNPLSGLFLSIVHASITAIIYLARSIQHLSMLDREK